MAVDNPSPDRPHLSHSRINRYLTCPEQYRLYYVEGLRRRFPSANLVFGQTVHRALASLFQEGEDPVDSFLDGWKGAQDLQLAFSRRDSWETLRASGEALLRQFVAEELSRIGDVEASEQPFEIEVSSLDLPLIGVIDLMAPVDDTRTVVDFKTAGARYQGHEAQMSDQLTAYQLAEPGAEQVALCVLVKTKTPRIEWQKTRRSAEAMLEYLKKAQLVARDITQSRFFKRPGMWCQWCDFLPVCIGDTKRAKETLIQLQ